MLEICGGLLFVGVGRLELSAMAPCRRPRRSALQERQRSETDDAELDVADYPPLRLVRG
ncbi:MAG: hypothetical protein H7066_15525 [Cytophagaceae bacterium]|nr:hypothetical protein [Gemmatimonadaceae bacterium]